MLGRGLSVEIVDIIWLFGEVYNFPSEFERLRGVRELGFPCLCQSCDMIVCMSGKKNKTTFDSKVQDMDEDQRDLKSSRRAMRVMHLQLDSQSVD